MIYIEDYVSFSLNEELVKTYNLHNTEKYEKYLDEIVDAFEASLFMNIPENIVWESVIDNFFNNNLNEIMSKKESK